MEGCTGHDTVIHGIIGIAIAMFASFYLCNFDEFCLEASLIACLCFYSFSRVFKWPMSRTDPTTDTFPSISVFF